MDEQEAAVKEGDEIPVVLTLAAVDPLPPYIARKVAGEFPALGPLAWDETLPAAHPASVAFVGRSVFVPGDCIVVGTLCGQAVRIRRAMVFGTPAWTWTHKGPLDALPEIITLVRDGMAKLVAGG